MLKKILIATGFILAAVCVFFGFAFFGNPVSKALATKNAGEYLNENLPDENYGIESVKYDFKTSDYYAEAVSPDGVDNHFTLYCDYSGKVTFSTYESAVDGKWNTAQRINDEYRKAVDEMFAAGALPYAVDISFGDIEFADSDLSEDEAAADYAIINENLTLNGEYDIYETGRNAGTLTVYVSDYEVSYEKLSEILLTVKALADKENVGFRGINCVLEYPVDETGETQKDGRAEVRFFDYDDIYEDGLVQRVKAADDEAKAYYASQDK